MAVKDMIGWWMIDVIGWQESKADKADWIQSKADLIGWPLYKVDEIGLVWLYVIGRPLGDPIGYSVSRGLVRHLDTE